MQWDALWTVDSLVVRNLSQDGIKGSSTNVVNNLCDPKEGLGRSLILDEPCAADFVDVMPDVLLRLAGGIADLFLEALNCVVHQCSIILPKLKGVEEAPSA